MDTIKTTVATYANQTQTTQTSNVSNNASNVEMSKLNAKTIQLANKQVNKPMPKQDRLAKAINEVHYSGTSEMKVKPNRFVKNLYKSKSNKHKPHNTRDKTARKSMIDHRREEMFKYKFGLGGAMYEGLFDTTFDLKVEDATMENFRKLFEVSLKRAKETINNNKVLIEHSLKLDSEVLIKTLTSLAAAAVGGSFLFAIKDQSIYWKIFVGSLTALAAMYPHLNDFANYLTTKVINRVIGFNADDRAAAIRDDLAEHAEEIESWLFDGEVHSQAHITHRSWFDWIKSTAGYEGLFDHGFGACSFVFSDIAAAAATAITGIVINQNKTNILQSFLKNTRMKADLTCVLTELCSTIAKVVDTIAGTSFSNMFKKAQVLEDWGDDVLAIYNDHMEGKLTASSDNSRRVYALQMKGLEIARTFDTMSASSWAFHRLAMGMIAKMESVLTTSGATVTERQVPMTLCLKGESGIGKSYITHAIIDEIAMRVLPKEKKKSYLRDHSSEKYLWLSEEEFANGYNGQFATIFDDFGQMDKQKGQKDDFQAIIRMCNAAPCRLNAAELEKKGKLVFTSPLIVASTNLYKFKGRTHLAKHEALVRRFDVYVEMVPRVEFCTEDTKHLQAKERRLDRTKLVKAMEYDACEYRIMKIVDPDQETFEQVKVCTFEELISLCTDVYTRHRDNHAKLMDALQVRRNELMAEADYEGILSFLQTSLVSSKKMAETVAEKFTATKATMKAELIGMYLKYKGSNFTIELRTVAIVLAVLIGTGLIIWLASKISARFFKKKDPMVSDYEIEFLEKTDQEPRLFCNKIMKSIIWRNVYHIYKPGMDFNEDISYGKVTFVTGTRALMNYHYISQLRAIARMEDRPFDHIIMVSHHDANTSFQVPLTWFLDERNVSYDIESDLAIVDFKALTTLKKDIIKFFVTDETIRANQDFDAYIMFLRGPRCTEKMTITHKMESSPLFIKDNEHNGLISYKADTMNGDCGSLVAYMGDYKDGMERVVGIHMASLKRENKGFATIVTQEKINDLLKYMDWAPRIEREPEAEGDLVPGVNTCHIVVKELENPVFQPRTTSYTESMLHNELQQATKRPAQLRRYKDSEGKVHDPLMNAHMRQHTYNKQVDTRLLETVKYDVIKFLKPFIKNTGKKLSFEEAVKSTTDLPFLGPIPRKTSAGFTYRTDKRVKNGKKEFFGQDGDYEFTSEVCEELKLRVDHLEEQCKEGIVPEDRVYTDVLKDEPLANKKVDIGKTRMISACDLPMTVLYRKYYGALCNDLVRTRIFNSICVGMNPYSSEWDILAKHLLSKGGRIVAGDFSGYDNSQSSQLITAVMDVMGELTGLKSEDDIHVLKTLGVTLSQPYHASGGHIYELDHGMPSGNPMTTIMNSIFGMIAFRLVWVACMDGEYEDMEKMMAAFNENVNLAMYGDDNLLGIADKVTEKFNQNTMMEKFPLFGLKYTSDQKDDEHPPPTRNLEEITFLKRTFEFSDVFGRYIAPLDKDTIINMLHWTHAGPCARAITIDNCDNALREWSMHGFQYYTRMSRLLAEACERKMNYNLTIPDWMHMLLKTNGFKPKWIQEHI